MKERKKERKKERRKERKKEKPVNEDLIFLTFFFFFFFFKKGKKGEREGGHELENSILHERERESTQFSW